MLYVFIFIYSILGVLGVHGLDKERNIHIRRSISEGRVIKNENNSRRKRTNRNNILLSDESFMLIRNEENIKRELNVRLLSLNKEATQSSSFSGVNERLRKASNAVDGKTRTDFFYSSCTHTNTEDYPWWRVNLMRNYIITSIHIYNREDCCSERLHKINVMITNTTYTNPLNIPSKYRCGVEIDKAPSKGQILKIDCNNLIGKYVTVFINDKSSILTLCEVQVYGDDISPCETDENDCNLSNSKCVLKNEEYPVLGYTCECLQGFKKTEYDDKECIDIDECQTGQNNCNTENTMCINLEGSYKCETIQNEVDILNEDKNKEEGIQQNDRNLAEDMLKENEDQNKEEGIQQNDRNLSEDMLKENEDKKKEEDIQQNDRNLAEDMLKENEDKNEEEDIQQNDRNLSEDMLKENEKKNTEQNDTNVTEDMSNEKNTEQNNRNVTQGMLNENEDESTEKVSPPIEEDKKKENNENVVKNKLNKDEKTKVVIPKNNENAFKVVSKDKLNEILQVVFPNKTETISELLKAKHNKTNMTHASDKHNKNMTSPDFSFSTRATFVFPFFLFSIFSFLLN